MSRAAAKRFNQAYGEEPVRLAEPQGPNKTKLDKRDWTFIVILCIVAGALRVATLGHAPLWFDELWTWHVSHSGFDGLFNALKEDIHVPNFFAIEVTFIKLFGDSEFVMRLPAAIFGTLSIGAIYVLGRRLFGRNVGVAAAIMLAFEPFTFYYSQEARPYSMMLFLGIVSSYLWYKLYERIFEDQEPAGRLAFGLWLVLAASCFTHYFCCLLTIFQITIFAVIAFKRKRGRQTLIRICFGLFVLAALWVPMLAQQLHNLFTWTKPATFLPTLKVMDLFTFGWLLLPDWLTWTVDVILMGVMCLCFWKKPASGMDEESSNGYYVGLVLVALWFGPYFFTELISILITPIFVDRYLLFCLPFAYLAVCSQIARFKIPAPLRLAIPILLVGLAGGYVQYMTRWYTAPERNDQGDWRSVITRIRDKIPSEGKTVVFAVTERIGVAPYYFGKLLPNVPIAGTANNHLALGKAYEDVMRQHPDHIVYFFGQCVQEEQRLTAAEGANALAHRFGPPEVLSFVRGMPIGALLFDTHGRFDIPAVAPTPGAKH